MVQWWSYQPGGLQALAVKMLHLAPDIVDEACVLVEWLTEFALNPNDEPTPAFLSALRIMLKPDRLLNPVVTEIGRALHSALDYSLEQRCMVVIEGVARIGKTFAVSDWCEVRPGRVRYMQCPSTNDDVAFFTALANGLGITVEHNPKAKSLRPRIEDTLQSGDLMLVIDEAHNCWPSYSYRNARPSRICWLMTALVNFNVPVALIVTPQFFRSQKVCEERIGWASEQFVGRIGDYVKLSDELSLDDLRAVARAHLPEGDAKSIEALALYAGSSQKYLAAIEHAVKKARFLAGKAGREVCQADVRTAIESGLVPTDSALAGALRNVPARTVRGGLAGESRSVREGLATSDGRAGELLREGSRKHGSERFYVDRVRSQTATG